MPVIMKVTKVGDTIRLFMALDKFYGPSNKLKEFIDLCHQKELQLS
jgi:1,4-alpha-glucan branching enzyme